MEELNSYLNDLPDFLRAELDAHVGSIDGIEPFYMTDRYIHAINDMVSRKRAPLQQVHVDNIPSIYGQALMSKSDIELNARLRAIPGIMAKDFFSMTVYAQFYMESIRFLNDLKAKLESLSARIKEANRQRSERLAQEGADRESARIQALVEEAARRAAEEATRTRAKAEEAARHIAEANAAQHRALEAALQLAKRQVEEAARQEADETRRLQSQSVRKVETIFGPDITQEISVVFTTLKKAIGFAVDEFSDSLRAHGVSTASHFEAVAKMKAFD